MSTEQKVSTGGQSGARKLDRVLSEGFLFKGAIVLEVIGGVALMLLALISFGTVVLRNTPLAGAWLVGGADLSGLLMAIVSVFACAVCWYKGGHLRIDIVKVRCSQMVQNIIDVFSTIGFIIFIGIIAFSGWDKAIEAGELKAVTMAGGIPIFPFMALFCLALTHFVLVLLRSLWGKISKVRGRHVEHDGLY